jgi:hypothetical protein
VEYAGSEPGPDPCGQPGVRAFTAEVFTIEFCRELESAA